MGLVNPFDTESVIKAYKRITLYIIILNPITVMYFCCDTLNKKTTILNLEHIIAPIKCSPTGIGSPALS